ncbi:MAG: hypothetical protein SNJ52_02305 [Verrucomicrobiia bacterium]
MNDKPNAFTLYELAVALSLALVLATIVATAVRAAVERSHEVVNISNLRQIGMGIHSYLSDNNGTFWTLEDIGRSSFRAVDDPLGLPVLLSKYVDKQTWWNPAGMPVVKEYGNNYAWNRNSSLLGRPAIASPNLYKTSLVWDNYTFTLPSVRNVSEPSTGGPRNAPRSYWRYPHRGNTAAAWLQGDGRVIIR